MSCDCDKCECSFPLETYLGTVNSAGASLPLEQATVICGRCKQNLSCVKCRGEDK
jgi:hypothetical protein